jgi:hypothetical protein
MSAEILLDTSSPVITINQSSLLFKINQNYFQNQLKNSNSSNTLYPLIQTELLLTNITSSYIAYRSRITKKKYYSVEPSHLIIPPNSNITIKITFYHNFRNTFPPEGHKFRFEGIVIPNNMKKMDAWKIYEQFSKDKTEVKGNSIRKVAEFIFDNNYNPNFEEENKKIDISQSMNSINLNDFNGTASIYSNALGRSNERPSRIALKNMKKNMRDVNKEETFNPMKLKDECEKLENDYNNYLKELNEIKQKINDLNAKNKYRYIVPDINFSSINKKMFFILFGVSFLLGFFLTK